MKKITLVGISANPIAQVVVVLCLSLTCVCLDKLGVLIGAWSSPPNNTWVIMTAFILFFAMATSILSLKADHMNRYWTRSIVAFIGLIGLSILFATVLSGLSMDEAGSFRWLFVVMTVGYLVFLVIVRSMRRIVDIVIKQDKHMSDQ